MLNLCSVMIIKESRACCEYDLENAKYQTCFILYIVNERPFKQASTSESC